MKISKLILAALAALALASCGTSKNYVMLNDINEPGQYRAPERRDLRIKKGDELTIVVSHHDPTIARLFSQLVTSSSTSAEGEGGCLFRVNSLGYVHLPLFDSVRVSGLTCQEVSTLLANRLEDEGIAYGATVTVRIAGFKVTIIGETVSGVFQFEDNGATVLDLMAQANLAGATASSTRRDQILVMRERDSVWQTDYISLLTSDLFYSPYFYLEQNDVFYLYPTKSAIWKSDQRFDFWQSRVTLVTSLLSVVSTLLLYFAYKK